MVTVVRVTEHPPFIRKTRWSVPRHICSLPVGFRFLVDRDGDVIEPALLFIFDTYTPAGVLKREKTVKTYVEALYEWFSHLEALEDAYELAIAAGDKSALPPPTWNQVTAQHLLAYSVALESAISPLTFSALSTATKHDRMRTIIALYQWAFFKGYYTDFVNLKEVYENSTKKPRARIPRAIPIKQLVEILKRLGPLPSECVGQEHKQKSRDRLAAEFALRCGLRIDEVTNLTVRQITKLIPHRGPNPHKPVALPLTHTKGGEPREVALPSSLLREVLAYIDGERAEVVNLAKSQGTNEIYTEPANLFVNGADASQEDIGKPLTTHRLSVIFHDCVIACGFFSVVYEQGHANARNDSRRKRLVALYTFHFLRHTFVYSMYYALQRVGVKFPWRTIQILLGHAHLSTTVKYYMRGVGTAEKKISDAVVAVARFHADRSAHGSA
ncbi:site-specific integrase [Paraburkholderia sp. J76]|uniref:tyrosine-type recombinase/integrase n=1 Tax=Paraburkholderia sp. J76 TaxID=2805439 RepID=UPI002ABD1CBE|nr:site-specific integrase [Paraburkholderia sp. J76]